jgi:mono/diheme cytochrome c family protein
MEPACGSARGTTASVAVTWGILFTVAALAGCKTSPPAPADPVSKGRQIFFNETFNGNGRTCGTCHREEANFGIDPAFIATLPANDALFVAEFNPELSKNFENPKLMRQFGLILENLDGFDDLDRKFVMRGVPHTLGLRTSVQSPQGPRTGWSGDGAPGDGSLRSFATGAVIQHFTKTLKRVPGVDFRLPTDEELDALEAFQLSLGRQQELQLPLPLRGVVAKRGQQIFLDNSLGKCNLCHANAGANANFGGGSIGNANFNTGVEDLPDQPADLTGELVPPDDGFGRPGDGTFNTPPLVQAADTGPFFHNNAIETIEGAVAFYDGATFNNSPAGRTLAGADPNGIGIKLDATQIVEVAAFLRVINALENIRVSLEKLDASTRKEGSRRKEDRELLDQAAQETDDAIEVLAGGGLHPEAVVHLRKASSLTEEAARSWLSRRRLTEQAIEELKKARAALVEIA